LSGYGSLGSAFAERMETTQVIKQAALDSGNPVAAPCQGRES